VSKLAATVAAQILADVMADDWPVGEVFGSEADLLEQYGVSRAVFREAVRLVEHQQVATMRRGPGGGLVVIEPSAAAIIDASVLYLHRVDARLDEVFAARLALEQVVAGLATERLDEGDLLRLRALVDAEASGDAHDHRAMHTLLASITRNPALELFVDLLNRVTLLYFDNTNAVAGATLSESAHAHERIAAAVMGGDDGLARRRMRTHLEAEAAFLRKRRSAHQMLDPAVAMAGPAGNKGAERVARSIFRDIVARSLPPGTLLGSETDLTAQYEVSRAVFREAVRILEHHQIATMRRGPGGGLFVTPPSAAAVTEVVAIYLARRGVRVQDLTEVRVGVELALIDLLVECMDDERAERLRAALLAGADANGEFVNTAHDLHATIAALAGNRALELVSLVLIRLTRLRSVEGAPKARKAIEPEVYRTHEGIVTAIIDRDRELARHRMRRHLSAVASHLV
jgi:DNA-binding FadR family transcriptional regulator